MNIPKAITYQGKVHNVLGYAGRKYRLSDGTFADIVKCGPVIEGSASEPKAEIEPAAADNQADQSKPQPARRGGRPKKIKVAE